MNFLDLSEDVTSDFEVLPVGSYNVVCETVELKDTKAGTGQYINTKFKVVVGEYEGRSIFTMFNIKNPNVKAVEIGRAQLKSFMKAAGLDSFVLGSVTDLEGLKCSVNVKIKEDDFGKKNNISYYKPSTEVMTEQSNEIPF